MFTLLAGGCPAPPNPVLHAYLSAEKVGGFYGLNRGTGVIYEHCIICVIAVRGIMYAVFKDQRISHFRVKYGPYVRSLRFQWRSSWTDHHEYEACPSGLSPGSPRRRRILRRITRHPGTCSCMILSLLVDSQTLGKTPSGGTGELCLIFLLCILSLDFRLWYRQGTLA
ncbi:hypothetical protein TESG_01579 [Trichophyton tonsurans CBS 112818]|uniref:Uncharacterized protein n=1 Tax=Trichophyton tonsurans (strain CBS 112818) TaxID=647933 RepID=F2RR73_TRIT1|nr:hypothetical protein TESG_01579 [Trichophyton tonsurans CBS 112818]